MRKAFMSSTATRIPFTGKRLVEPYPEQDLCGTEPARRALEPGGDGRGLCSILTCGPITPPMRNWAAFRRSREIKFSLVSNRGCFGGCSFCALTFHQGRIIQTRSHESIVEEAKLLTEEPDFKGYIHDVGGPTADFRVRACEKQVTRGVCPNRQCLFPEALQEPSGGSRAIIWRCSASSGSFRR